MRLLAISFVWACKRKCGALIGFTLVQLLMVISYGSSFHHKDLMFPYRVLHLLSPMRWAHSSLLAWEFATPKGESAAGSRFLCTNNPIIQQENAILIKADCGFEQREHVLRWFDIVQRPIGPEMLCFALVSLVALVVISLFFCCCSGAKNGGWKHRLRLYKWRKCVFPLQKESAVGSHNLWPSNVFSFS